MDVRIPPLEIKIMLESNPLKSRILARRLAVVIFANRPHGKTETYSAPLPTPASRPSATPAGSPLPSFVIDFMCYPTSRPPATREGSLLPLVFHHHMFHISGDWKCAIAGVPWRGSVSACLAWGDVFVKNMFLALASAEKAEPSETPWHTYDGTPTTAGYLSPQHRYLQP